MPTVVVPQGGAEGGKPKQANIGPGPKTSSSPPVTRSKGEQSIAILVNDEPITTYEIEKRAALLALQGGGGGGGNNEAFKAKAEARWKQIVKDPKTAENFKELLKRNNVQSQEQARALQTTYIKGLQKAMVDRLRGEMRAGMVAGSKDKARDELIDERLKLQAARQLNVLADDAEVDKVLSGMAERNKMNLDQFSAHMAQMGTDIRTMRSRFKAEMSWREVIRQRFGRQVAITERDVDRFVAQAPQADDQVELQVQRITLPVPAKVDQGVIAQRIAEADGIAQRYTGCANTKSLAATVAGAKFEDLGTMKPGMIPEPTRSLLLNATEGDMLPPSVSQGAIELWALCSRKSLSGDAQKRENAESQLRQKEFEVLAQKHLKDLRQDAAIEYR